MDRKANDAVCKNPVKSHSAAFCATWRRDRDLWEVLERGEWQ